jgi:hypothetical protein
MATAPKQSKPVTFPDTFRAAITYVLMLGAFSACGVALTWASFHAHKVQAVQVVSALTGIILGLFLVVLSASVKVDDDGIVERWFAGKNATKWDEVAVIDKMQSRGIAIKNTSGRNLTLFTLLTTPVQEAIADEIVRRAGLRQVTGDDAKKKLRRQGIVEQWTKN